MPVVAQGLFSQPGAVPPLEGSHDAVLEQMWQREPSISVLRKAARAALGMSVNQQAQWSKRLRSAGLWCWCPLVATAQDGSRPVGERALAAAFAWALDRDRQARAVLRCLLPALSGTEKAEVERALGAPAIEDLTKGPLVWSVTPFFNELDILEARLREMARVVDRFIVIEAPVTQRGTPKPLYFEQNRSRFARWSTQLDHCVVDLPEGPSNWARERRQRDVSSEVLADLGAAPEDLVLSNDVDEIVRADRIPAILSATEKGPAILMMTMYWYSLDWRDPVPWLHPKAFRFGQVPTGASYSDVRHSPFPVVTNAGWHLSWFGDRERMITKMQAVADDVNTEQNRSLEHQDAMLGKGIAVHGRKLVRSDDYLPESLSGLFVQPSLASVTTEVI